jgi:AcrR family transcriptional regulator
MARPPGTLDANHSSKRQALLDRLREALLGDSAPSSFRQLAEAAGVTIPTLRHYFGNREAVLAAVFADAHLGGEREMASTRLPSGPFAISVRDLIFHLDSGFEYGGLTQLHAAGLVEGLRNAEVAGAYLREILEPTIDAIQERLEKHIQAGDMRPADPRAAALALVSPIVLIWLHQSGLGGAKTHPLDRSEVLESHAMGFIRAYGA